MAIFFGFLGLSGNPLLLLIALFVWIGAEGRRAQVQERLTLGNIPVREAMLTDFRTLSPGDTLGHATDLLLAGTQQVFPVIIDGRHAGVLTRDALMKGLSQHGREGSDRRGPSRELGASRSGRRWCRPSPGSARGASRASRWSSRMSPSAC